MINKLILVGFIPLLKKGVKEIDLDLSDILNILLGRNGFGKTTLLGQFSPLPPDNADYAPDGYKEWWYKDDRGTFILKSKTGKNSHHEFIFNGTNLNQGNTLLVQRELVKTYFKITPNINNVLTGLDVRDLFTTLSTAKRKEFLMAVNPNDTSYALKIFEKLKSNYNTIKGGLRTQRQRLVTEEGRMNQMASLSTEDLQKEIQQMDGQLRNALYIHGQLSQIEYQDLAPLKHSINNIISQLLGNNPRIKHTKSHYLQRKERLLRDLDDRNKLSTKLSAVLGEVTTQLQGFNVEGLDLSGLQSRLDMILDSIHVYEEEIKTCESFFINHDYFHRNKLYSSKAILHQGLELIDQIQMVYRTTDKEITSEGFRVKEQKLVHLKNEYNNIEQEIVQLNHTLSHFSKAQLINCPECKTDFKLGFEKFDVNKITAKRDNLAERSVELSKEIKRYEEYIESNTDWYSSMSVLMRYLKRSHFSEDLIDLIKEYDVGKRDPAVLIECIRRSISLNELKIQTNRLREESTQLIAQIKFLQSNDVAALFQRAEDVERELAITQRSIGRIVTELAEVNNLIDVIVTDELLRDQLEILIDEITEKVNNNGKYQLKIKVEEIVNELSPRKDQLISSLIRAQSLHSVIDSIKENIADMEKKEKHLLLLMDGLSPVKGLIGYLMNDFLKAVIGNINAIIQPVWSGRLVVLNCEASKSDDDSVDLNYQFPVISGDSNKPNKDIGNCSGGEREIINLAFRLTILRYLGNHCPVPLIMDEVGVNFDELHRRNFCNFIASLLRTDKVRQLVMVSHYINQFGMFADANIIALNVEGLSVPAEVNKKSRIR